MRRFWPLAVILFLALAGPSTAQQQPQAPDPLRGQFGAFEVAPTPMEAAHQGQLLGRSLAALQPQRRGRLDVYLITISMWGDPVFEREAADAEAILRQHFNAEGRSIILSAGAQGPRNFPSASPANVAAAFGQVGSLIDPNEDLVVVFVTSHGTSDGAISIRENGRIDASMRPQHLAQLMYLANIKNRVVILSACFSGAFVPPLANDNTIVLTAAAADRSSFGCQPQNQWTFFGDALFNRALRNGAPLLAGFDQAKVQIEAWEREQNLSPPSNPQSSVGASAAAMLARAERGGR